MCSVEKVVFNGKVVMFSPVLADCMFVGRVTQGVGIEGRLFDSPQAQSPVYDDKLTSQQLDKSRRMQTDKVDQSTFSKMHNKVNARSTQNQTTNRTDRDSRMSQRAVTKSTDATKKRGESVEGKQD